MQQDKVKKNNSELEVIGTDSSQLTSSLTSVMDKFQLKWHLSIFDGLKSKGLAISSLISIIFIMPFYGYATVCQLMRHGLKGSDFTAKKQAYYDAKNNEFIDWRKLLMYHAKRFMYLIKKNVNLHSDKTTALIFDDSLLPKTGKKIERVSMVHDHVSNRHVLGYKILVCGFWDGESFIPVDFSLHREKGKKQERYLSDYHKSSKAVEKQKAVFQPLTKSHQKKECSYLKHKKRYEEKPTATNNKLLANSFEKLEEVNSRLRQAQKEMARLKAEKNKAYNALKRFYYNGTLFGLERKEREAQFKKAVSTKSHGFKRRKECDKGKIVNMLAMLGRVVSKGITPDYVLVDSWFFCYELLDKLHRIKKGAIRLAAMVKMGNIKFRLCSNDRDMPVKSILKAKKRHARRCRKLKAEYIKVPCMYKGIRVNLFFVRMGKCKTWKLLVTTDLSVNFIRLMEVYQIRWSIEVFFYVKYMIMQRKPQVVAQVSG